MSLEFIGWLGSICFAICGAPQAIVCIKQGHAKGVSAAFMALWGAGEVLTIAYMWPKQDWPILFNLFSNLLFILIIVRYLIWPRRFQWVKSLLRLVRLKP